MTQNVHTTFTSEKVNKIRWCPDPLNPTNSFITGSWDNNQNSIKLWSFEEKPDDPDIYPFVIKSQPFPGDVTETRFVDQNRFVSSSSCGSAFQFKIHTTQFGSTELVKETEWTGIHKFEDGERSPCTALAVNNTDVVTIGEDGRINMLSAQKGQVVREIRNADSCSLQCVTFIKHNEILTGNMRGLMKIWDLRSPANEEPSNTFMFSSDQVAATCLTVHPTQRHMVVAGDEEGSLTVWDLRQNTFPVNLLSAHVESVSEIQFHPDHPDQLFSCSSSGELWHWTTNRCSKRSGMLMNFEDVDSVNPWFSADTAKSKFEVFMLMPKLHKPVNSLDVSGDKVLCGCDNEAVFLISNVNIYN